MKDIKAEYKKLIKSTEFKKKGFLCSVFIMSDIENLDKSTWQFDFYDESNKEITSYLMESKIKVTENLEVFKKEETEVEQLNLNEVELSIEKALKISEEILEKEKEKSTKIIIILQQKDRSLWNISYVTTKFNLINIKIDAKTGEIVENTSASLLSFKS